MPYWSRQAERGSAQTDRQTEESVKQERKENLPGLVVSWNE